jgi:hypothetical protein
LSSFSSFSSFLPLTPLFPLVYTLLEGAVEGFIEFAFLISATFCYRLGVVIRFSTDELLSLSVGCVDRRLSDLADEVARYSSVSGFL